MKNRQPAELSYFFYGGFVDLAQVISGTFEECGIVIGKSKEGLTGVWSGFDEIPAVFRFIVRLFMSSFHLFKLVFCSVITPLICLLISMFQVTILFSLFFTSLVVFLFIIISDRIYCGINAIATHCPICQTHFTMPVYICPECGEEHTKLRPGIYGILYRKCNCGKKLPTTFFNGRQKLQAICPECKNNIKGGGLQASWCIPVVGGPSSGKTCYINMTMMSLEKNSESRYGLSFVYENNGLDEYEENSNRLSRGYLPEKTTDYRLRYYQFSLTPKKTTKQLISLCDVAGELFDVQTGGNEIVKQIGFRYANAFILLVDPLSVSAYRSEVSKTENLDDYKGSVQRLDEMLDTFIGTLQNMFSIKASSMLNTSVAVVFTKADIPGLDLKIGKNAVLKRAAKNDLNTIYQTQNQLCEQFLREYNEDGFLNDLKSRFKSIQFFACSALGHIKNGHPFIASDVDEPFFWLVKKKSKVIRNRVAQ